MKSTRRGLLLAGILIVATNLLPVFAQAPPPIRGAGQPEPRKGDGSVQELNDRP